MEVGIGVYLLTGDVFYPGRFDVFDPTFAINWAC
jgi:hypothetical protein